MLRTALRKRNTKNSSSYKSSRLCGGERVVRRNVSPQGKGRNKEGRDNWFKSESRILLWIWIISWLAQKSTEAFLVASLKNDKKLNFLHRLFSFNWLHYQGASVCHLTCCRRINPRSRLAKWKQAAHLRLHRAQSTNNQAGCQAAKA